MPSLKNKVSSVSPTSFSIRLTALSLHPEDLSSKTQSELSFWVFYLDSVVVELEARASAGIVNDPWLDVLYDVIKTAPEALVCPAVCTASDRVALLVIFELARQTGPLALARFSHGFMNAIGLTVYRLWLTSTGSHTAARYQYVWKIVRSTPFGGLGVEEVKTIANMMRLIQFSTL